MTADIYRQTHTHTHTHPHTERDTLNHNTPLPYGGRVMMVSVRSRAIRCIMHLSVGQVKVAVFLFFLLSDMRYSWNIQCSAPLR